MQTSKITLLIVILIGLSNQLLAQQKRDIFDPKVKMTWLGLDFAGAKFIGDEEKFQSESDTRKLIMAWNNLMINEAEKFDVGKALQRAPLPQAIPITIAHNEQLNIAGMVEKSALLHLNKEDISRIVSSYDFGSQSGLGVIFIVESFSKTDLKGLIWVTFINMDSKEVLLADRYTGKPGGFGLRNYWAGSIYNILKQVKTNYEKWKKKYQ